MIHLKTNEPFETQRYGVLVEPEDNATSDEELYASVEKHGKAIVWEYDGPGFKLKEEKTTLTPEQFKKEWRGD